MLMRLEATTGMSTCSATALLMSTNALLGTEVTIVGTRASCQPKPLLMIVAPAASHFGCQGDDFVPALTVLDVVGHRHPVADDEVVADGRAGASHNLDGKAPPLLRCPAPGVGALVGPRCQKLVEQIPLAAHDLDTVIAGVGGQHRAAREVVDRAVDIA